MVSTRWLSDSAWPSYEPAEVPTKPGHTRRDWPATRGTRRRGQEKGAFTCPASKSARCPHPSVSPGLAFQAEALWPNAPILTRGSTAPTGSGLKRWIRQEACYSGSSSRSPEPSQAKSTQALSSGRSQRQKCSCQAINPDGQLASVREPGPGSGEAHEERQ